MLPRRWLKVRACSHASRPSPNTLVCRLRADLATTTLLMWYMQAANLLGLPAISVPIGAVPCTHATAAASGGGAGAALRLPAALQLMAPCWHEGSLLHAAAVLEAAVGAGAQRSMPPVWFDVLAPPSGASDGAGR